MNKLKVFLSFVFMVMLLQPINAVSRPDKDRLPKIEYSSEGVPSGRKHAPLRFNISVEEVNGMLQISFLGNISDVTITITDADGFVVYQETNGTIYDGKVIYITPADGYPYDVVITSPSIYIIGVISLE